MRKTKQLLAATGLVLLVACQGLSPEPTATPTPSATAVPTTTPLPTDTPTPTEIPPTATDTPTPTKTPRPTATPTPTIPPLWGRFPGSIVFTGIDSNGIQLYLIDMQTRDIRQLTDNQEINILPIWSPDGSRIAYARLHQDDTVSLRVIELGDGSDSLLLDGFTTEFLSISWSSDGRFLVFDGTLGTDTCRCIYRVSMQTGQLVNLTPGSSAWDAFPSFSPDGSRIAFTSDRQPGESISDDIWVMNSNGGSAVNLTPNGEFLWEDSHGAWGPEGERIAFIRFGILASPTSPGAPAGLWIVNADGSGEELITALDTALLSKELTWSPDGSWIAFGVSAGDDEEIWLVDVATGETRRIAKRTGSLYGITWAPDSSALAFTHRQGQDLEILVAAVDGSMLWTLFDDVTSGLPAWSP